MKRILSALLLALACTLAGCGNAKNRKADTVLVQIDSGQVSYLEANCLGLGPRTVRMEDDPSLILALITMLNGQYDYSDTLKQGKAIGDRFYYFTFYYKGIDKGLKLIFDDDYLYVVRKEGESYYKYKPNARTLDFWAFLKSVYPFGDEETLPVEVKTTENTELSEDFAFSIVWGTYGNSSYDSKTGKLVKTKNATDVSKYTCSVRLTKEQLIEVSRILLSDIDLFKYPDAYDPINAPDAEFKIMSEPNQTIILSVSANGRTKTVSCSEVAYGSSGYCEEARAFLNAENRIVELITSLPEWAAFPEYEFFYE